MDKVGTVEKQTQFSLMFTVEQQYAIILRRLCPMGRPRESSTIRVFKKVLQRLEVQARKMVKVSNDGSCVVISFPHCGDGYDEATFPQIVWHGTSLWSAYNIWHHGFVIGDWGHKKSSQGRHVNGIWGTMDFDHSLSRAATSKSYQPLCSQCPNGFF